MTPRPVPLKAHSAPRARPVPLNKQLYARVLRMYPGPSTAYRSGHIVQTYKRLGGRYAGASRPRLTGLHRWFLENWKSDTGKYRYTSRSSVYRPTRRVTKKTPVTFGELSRQKLLRAKRLKRTKGRAVFTTSRIWDNYQRK
jgi:hypothetical protein